MPTEAEFLALQSRVRELEDKLEALYRRLNLDHANPDTAVMESEALREALRRRNKIEAIKIYRGLTGVGLAEAKAAVEEMERRMLF